MTPPIRWALEWRGNETHIMWSDCMPLLFKTRKAAREYAAEHFGYIPKRADLRKPPHNWRMPRAIRVAVQLERRT